MRRAVSRRAVTRRAMMRRAVMRRAVTCRLVSLSEIRTSRRCGSEEGTREYLRMRENANPPLDPVLVKLIELSGGK